MVTSKLKDCPTRPECPNCGMAMVTIERTEHKDNVENCKFECCAAVTSRSASQRKLAGAGPADQAASCAGERLVQRWISSHRKLGLWATRTGSDRASLAAIRLGVGHCAV
jgi:hypothetical protein